MMWERKRERVRRRAKIIEINDQTNEKLNDCIRAFKFIHKTQLIVVFYWFEEESNATYFYKPLNQLNNENNDDYDDDDGKQNEITKNSDVELNGFYVLCFIRARIHTVVCASDILFGIVLFEMIYFFLPFVCSFIVISNNFAVINVRLSFFGHFMWH